MAQREVKQWITVNGVHVPIFDGQSKEEAVKNYIDREEKQKEKQIAKNKEQTKSLNHREPKNIEDIIKKVTGRDVDDVDLRKEIDEAFKERQKYSDEWSDLTKQLDKELDVPPNATREDREIAQIMGDYTAKGKEIKKQKDLAFKKYEEAEEKWRNKSEQFQYRVNQRREEELKEFKKHELEVSADIKNAYKGFQLNSDNSDMKDLLEKGKAQIVEMSPKEYLMQVSYEIFNRSDLQQTIGGTEFNSVMKYAKMMREGTQFYMPWLDYVNKGQEGRHRALAAYINGYDRIPVIIRTRR